MYDGEEVCSFDDGCTSADDIGFGNGVSSVLGEFTTRGGFLEYGFDGDGEKGFQGVLIPSRFSAIISSLMLP